MKALRRLASNPWAAGGLLVVLTAVATTLNTDFPKPPRGDGVGYAILGASLAEDRDYREIDKPDQPRHAHFPPGYPLVLAGVWSAAGRSEPAAHAVSIVATVLAVLLSWRWFRSLYAPAGPGPGAGPGPELDLDTPGRRYPVRARLPVLADACPLCWPVGSAEGAESPARWLSGWPWARPPSPATWALLWRPPSRSTWLLEAASERRSSRPSSPP